MQTSVIRVVFQSLSITVLIILGAFVQQGAAQTLQTTCPVVKAAVCSGRCSSSEPSLLQGGTCSTRARALLHDASAPAAGQQPSKVAAAPATTAAATPKSSSSAGTAPSAAATPKANWQLQRTASPTPHATPGAATHTAAAADGPPQRYLPYGIDSNTPPETPQQQQAIIKHLQDLMAAPPDNNNTTDTLAGSSQQNARSEANTSTAQSDNSGNTLGDGDVPATSATADADDEGSSGGPKLPAHSSSTSSSGVTAKEEQATTAAAAGQPLAEGVGGDSSETPQEALSSKPPPEDPTSSSPFLDADTVDIQVEQPSSTAAAATEGEQQQQQGQEAESFESWLDWFWQEHNNARKLQQQALDSKAAAAADSTALSLPPQQAPDTSTPDAASTAVPLLGPLLPQLSSSSSTLQCPTGTVFNSTEGTCVSSTDAFPTAAAQEAAVISTLKLEVQQGAGVSQQPTREQPIDPGTVGVLPSIADEAVVQGTVMGATAVTATTTRAAAVAPYDGPTSQVSRTLTMISNGKIRVGVDLDRAGTISWVSSSYAPAPWKDQNIINNWDQGRLLQQSFYGCVDGSCWASRPWLWNPVQGGSWQNSPGQTTRKLVKAGAYVYAEGLGRNWGKQDVVKDVKFTTNVTLLDNVAVVKYAMHYTGTVTHNYMTQEVPAVFLDRKFSVLAYYAGSKPWTNDKAITYAFPPGKNTYARPTEFWAAFIDPVTGWGLGVYNPMAWMGITAYRIGPDGADSRPWDCSYFAHTIRMQLHPGMKPYPYTVYVTVGRLDAIRATFYKLRTQPSVLAAQASTTAATRSLTPRTAAAGTGPADAVTTAGTEQQQLQQMGPQMGQPDLGRNTWYGQPLNYSLFDNVLLEGNAAAAAVSSGQGSTDGERLNPAGGGASGSSVGGDAAGASELGAAQSQQGLTQGQFAGVVVGAVAGCALMAGVVVVRAVQQRQAVAAAADSETQSLAAAAATGRGQGSSSSHNATRSPSKVEARSASKTAVTTATAASGNSECDGGYDGAVGVTVTPSVITRSAAKLPQ